jgi:hypothetical protein
MIRPIPLSLADVDEAQDLVPIDNERRRPGDVKCREPEVMINAIPLDDRTIRVGEDGYRQPLRASVRLNFFGALTDNDVYFGAQPTVGG